MSANPFIPNEFYYVNEATLTRACEEYRDLLQAIKADSSSVAGDLKLQVEAALTAIEAELAVRPLRGKRPEPYCA